MITFLEMWEVFVLWRNEFSYFLCCFFPLASRKESHVSMCQLNVFFFLFLPNCSLLSINIILGYKYLQLSTYIMWSIYKQYYIPQIFLNDLWQWWEFALSDRIKKKISKILMTRMLRTQSKNHFFILSLPLVSV